MWKKKNQEAKGIKPKIVKLQRKGVGDDYELRYNDGLIVGPMVQKEVLVPRQPAHYPT